MTARTQLVLDVGGVLGTNLTAFWYELADAASLPYEEVRRRYKQELRNTLWTGEISEPGFFTWACAMQSRMSEADARSLMRSCLQPMPAYAMLPAWSEVYDIHILSNHRTEWLRPFLEPVLPYLQTVTISSEVGCAKPSTEIYKLAAARFAEGAAILFVDDAEHNLEAAAAHGWRTLLADPESEWMKDISDGGDHVLLGLTR